VVNMDSSDGEEPESFASELNVAHSEEENMNSRTILYRAMAWVLLVALLGSLAGSVPTIAASNPKRTGTVLQGRASGERTGASLSLPAAAAGTGWEEVGAGSASGGGISNNGSDSRYPSIAVAPDGTPYVTWHDNSDGDYEVYVRRWTESSWAEIGAGSASGGGISDNDGNSQLPWVSIAPDGTLYVAWDDDGSGDREIYVRRWMESCWAEMSGSASGGGVSDNDGVSRFPRIAIASGGTIYITWQDDSDGDNEVYVRRWTGSSWVEMGGSASGGGISNNGGDSGYPSIDVAPDGTVYVAWQDDSDGDNEIYVRRWTGSSWAEVGAGSASGGGISNNSSDSRYPRLAIAPDGVPYVTWQDDGAGDNEIYVRRWTGSSWAEIGAGSASGGGISDNSGESLDSWLDVAPDGVPCVVWEDYSGGDGEIYVRYWNEGNWAETGAGSASGGGISDNSGDSRRPAVAIAPNGTSYVAWYDYSVGNYEIYVRQWERVMPSGPSLVYLPLMLEHCISYASPCDASNNHCEDYDSYDVAYGPLGPNVAYRAYPEDKKDYYYFRLRSTASVIVHVADYSALGWLVVRRDDPPDLTPIGWDERKSGGDTALEVILSSLSPGKYYVHIDTTSGYNTSTRYTLTVSY
jgi:hypothetical protein